MGKKIFSGVQPTGNLHLGNYIGAIKNFVDLQNHEGNECVYCVVDLHAITTKQDPKIVKNNIRETTAAFLASGLDPKKSIIFNQSLVPAHSEASWILGCVARMGWLNRMTQFKEKAGKDKEKASVGLYAYPVLMASDILLYDATHVPVGHDQKQHLEITRDLAIRFNNIYGDVFVIPEAIIQKNVATIPGIDGRKMSKSYGNVIPLFAPEKEFRKAIMKITTDSKSVNDPKDPETCNIFSLFKSFANENEKNDLAKLNQNGGMGYGEAKQICFEKLNSELKGPREIYHEIRDDKKKLREILELGREKARFIARKVNQRIRDKVGI